MGIITGVFDFVAEVHHFGVRTAVSNAVGDIKFEASKAYDYAKEHPVEVGAKVALHVGTAVAMNAVGKAIAPSVARAVGSTGVLGKCGTGKEISTLTGKYLERASLAKFGGGTLAQGGGGIKAGVALVGKTTSSVSVATVNCVSKSVTSKNK
ncbi:hypothetical protein [Photobacterium damselae]|uniref:hypothetical protein n=1 Tax=Photobacterium damselae TaxID=38293 RepID=UPI001F17ACFF|nr:hypothetical protein [Photobacterium damselae]UKA05002.1 hypothetical protein IHC89_22410 [Photobacterium damselae subsp. damselae]